MAALLGALPSLGCAASTLTITIVNGLPLARATETIELSAKDLAARGANDLAKIRDCQGRSVGNGTLRLGRTPQQLDVPISGIVELMK